MSRWVQILIGVLLTWWLAMAILYAIAGERRALWFGALFVVGAALILWRRRGARA